MSYPGSDPAHKQQLRCCTMYAFPGMFKTLGSKAMTWSWEEESHQHL